MTVKALIPVRTVNLVAPLAHKATDMHITETAAPVQAWSGAAPHLIGHGRLPGFDTEKPKENKLSAQISRLRLAANKTETELFA